MVNRALRVFRALKIGTLVNVGLYTTKPMLQPRESYLKFFENRHTSQQSIVYLATDDNNELRQIHCLTSDSNSIDRSNLIDKTTRKTPRIRYPHSYHFDESEDDE